MGTPSRFAFVDEGEAVRRLGVDRDTLVSLVRSGRLRAYPGVGKGSFFKLGDLLALAETLHPPIAAPIEPAAPAPTTEPAEQPPASRRPQHDPAYKVHLRLQADLKWYDLSDADFRAWVRELHPDAYPRQRTNITATIARLQQLLALMDEAAAGWKNLAAQPAAPEAPGSEETTPSAES
jgi:hypothetical protein